MCPLLKLLIQPVEVWNLHVLGGWLMDYHVTIPLSILVVQCLICMNKLIFVLFGPISFNLNAWNFNRKRHCWLFVIFHDHQHNLGTFNWFTKYTFHKWQWISSHCDEYKSIPIPVWNIHYTNDNRYLPTVMNTNLFLYG